MDHDELFYTLNYVMSFVTIIINTRKTLFNILKKKKNICFMCNFKIFIHNVIER